MKKKRERPIRPPRLDSEEKSVPMRSFIEGMVVRLLNGLNSRNVLKPDILLMEGKNSRREVTTTVKSNQFQASFR